MKAVRIHEYGGPEVLKVEDVSVPDVGPDEVLIQVEAAGVNPVDWKVRQGYLREMIPYSLPLVLGWDVSGTIARCGALVKRFREGDAVFSRPELTRNGTYAEYVAVRADEVAPAPKKITLEHAAGVPLAALTAWKALFDDAKVRSGQVVLIHAAAGGVGSFAVQLAKIAGARVLATASGPGVSLVQSLGADEVIDYRNVDFSTVAKDCDVVFDTIGGETRQKSWGVLKPGGVLVSVTGTPNQEKAKELGVRGLFTWVVPNGARLSELAAWIDAGRIEVPVDQVFALADVRAAHERSATGRAKGKILLHVR